MADPLIGRVVADRYRIVEQIGRGGMGVVYRVEHARIGKRMALKLLSGELTQDAAQVARFKREALMVSKLSHPNTVQVFDFGTAYGLVYLAMEYLRGEDLGKIIRREGALDVQRTAKLVVQICNSLAEAHEKGIVHRDLKPENILVIHGHSGEEIVKVLDFGLAKLRESPELSDLTSHGAIVGTPYYMSPEQIRGESVGPQSDVYALGALMYTCLTGSPVFVAGTPLGVLSQHLLEAPIAPHERSPARQIPESISLLLLRALEKDPSRRLQTVTELQNALLDELRGEGQASVELLLSTDVRKLVTDDSDAATRAEVERYERKLHALGRIAWAALAVLAVALVIGGYQIFRSVTREDVFDGREVEPNDSASQALAVPFARTVTGQIGRRLDEERSDRDFYKIVVPPGTKAVRVTTTSLPNMALCTWIYAEGSETAFGRYCAGQPPRDLVVDALTLPAGNYLFAVMQDRDATTHVGFPPVYENVSDDYQLTVAPARVEPTRESEPNDSERDAADLAVPGMLRGRLAFLRDVDVVCATGPARLRFSVEDAVHRARPQHAVLQVTALAGPDRDVPVRVHRTGEEVKRSARDTFSPWWSPDIQSGGARVCLELRLVPNPWAPTPHPEVAPASDEEYFVRVEAR
ncbi:MAG TPA: serine/threonine-protein kinase [Polyangiaceae bacterium]|nr:serine/threonine-protein kinase [Polyangiaceae bacterium]